MNSEAISDSLRGRKAGMDFKLLLVIVAIFGCTYAGQKCSGYPPKYNGKLCATTTRYADYHKGACGCGPDNNDNQYSWNHAGFNTAPNQLFFDAGGAHWCGHHCGRCVRLTTTGGYVDGQGGPTPAGRSKVFMVTNLCPAEAPNLSWCAQNNQHRGNQFGYHYHFDLENGVNQIGQLGWNNPEVTWEYVDCDQGHREDGRTPSNEMFHQCFCGKNGKRNVNDTFVVN